MNTCPVCKKTHTGRFNCCSNCLAASRRWKRTHYLQNLCIKHRIRDIQRNRYDESNHIDIESLQQKQIDQKGKCYHCCILVDVDNPCTDRGRWLQRLDNSVGHTNQNCVWSCRACNVRKVEEGNQKWLATRRHEAAFFNMVHGGYYGYLENNRTNTVA